MVATSDGKAIISYVDSGYACIATADSVAEVLAGTKSFGAGTQIKAVEYGNTSLALIDGKLRLAIIDYDDVDTDLLKCYYYADTDGTGASFSYVSMISEDLSSNAAWSSELPKQENGTGVITELTDDTWVIVLPFYSSNRKYAKCYYTTNGGTSWTAGATTATSLFYTSYAVSASPLVLSTSSFLVTWQSGSSIEEIEYFTANGATCTQVAWGDGWTGELGDYPGQVAFCRAGDTYYMALALPDTMRVYKLLADAPTTANIVDADNWELVISISSDGSSTVRPILSVTANALILQHSTGTVISGAGTTAEELKLRAKSIDIRRSRNMSSELTIAFDNKNGRCSPDILGSWHDIMFPGVSLYVEQGYGSDLIRTFTGTIDDVVMRTFPAELTLHCRDSMKLLLDQTVTSGANHTITYSGKTIEYIVDALATAAGFASVTTETTGITLATFTTEWESYGDAIQKLADMAGFEWHVDEAGAFYFVYPTDRQPEAADEAVVLNGTTAVDLAEYPVVTASIRVYSGAGEAGTLYVRDTDYTITEGDDENKWQITRIAGGSIGDGATVYVSYVYAAYVFREGEDIVSLGYTISGRDLATTIYVHGKDTDDTQIEATASYISSAYYNVLTGKVVKIDAPDADTAAKAQKVADRQELIMRTKPRICQHQCVAVPWLQIGDTIQIIETTTGISEAYRIIDMSTSQTAGENGSYLMDLTTYHYGYSVAS
jgi:hypothetical protein